MAKEINKIEAVIGVAITSVFAIAKYSTFSGSLPLPEGIDSLPSFLSTATLLIIVLLTFYLGVSLRNLPKSLVILGVLFAAAGGVWQALEFKKTVQEQSIEVDCADDAPKVILEPQEMSNQLKNMVRSSGNIQQAWCNGESNERLKSLVRKENSGLVFWLSIQLIVGEVLLGLAIAISAWVTIVKNNDRV